MAYSSITAVPLKQSEHVERQLGLPATPYILNTRATLHAFVMHQRPQFIVYLQVVPTLAPVFHCAAVTLA